MSPDRRRNRAVRWGVPIAAAAVVVAAAGAGPVIAAVQGDPVLPSRTAEQLLADLMRNSESGTLPPLSGTVVETASLGLPVLPGLSGSGSGSGTASPLNLLAGVNQVKVWYGGEGRMRLALPGRMSETDLIVNGDQAWLWESATNTATRLNVPPEAARHDREDRETGEDRKGGEHGEDGKGTDGHGPSPLPTGLTPQEAAREVLARVDDSTAVSVTNTERVADRAAYQLVIAPKDESSLVREIRLAVDGETLVPLRVQILADGSAEPAFEVGFTSVTFTPPAPEMFAFTPPAGAKVTESTIGGERPEEQGKAPDEGRERPEGVKRIGEGWTTIVSVPMSEQELLDSARPGGEGRNGDPGEAQNAQEIIKSVLQQARPVTGEWGSGKIIETKLVSVLITDDGRVLAGAVTPEALIKAAGTK